MIPSAEVSPPPCTHCGGARTSLTCTCLGCRDLTFSCGCQPAVDALMAQEGLCDGCVAGGCGATLADFARCRRLTASAG